LLSGNDLHGEPGGVFLAKLLGDVVAFGFHPRGRRLPRLRKRVGAGNPRFDRDAILAPHGTIALGVGIQRESARGIGPAGGNRPVLRSECHDGVGHWLASIRDDPGDAAHV
jgi:hypothetical protein